MKHGVLGNLIMFVILAAYIAHTRRALNLRQPPSLKLTTATGWGVFAGYVVALVVDGGGWFFDWALAGTWLFVAGSVTWVCHSIARRRRANRTERAGKDYSGDPTRLPPWARPEPRETERRTR